jgi:hypothetical protein
MNPAANAAIAAACGSCPGFGDAGVIGLGTSGVVVSRLATDPTDAVGMETTGDVVTDGAVGETAVATAGVPDGATVVTAVERMVGADLVATAGAGTVAVG